MARPACIYFVHSWVNLCASKSSSAGITLDKATKRIAAHKAHSNATETSQAGT